MENHYILGLERKNSGAFEHSWNLGLNLNKKYPTRYFSHWWDNSPEEISFKNESSKTLNLKELKKANGVFHLQTHTWENAGLLEEIAKKDSSKIIYNIHAIIPYLYLNEKEKIPFLQGELNPKIYQEIVNEKMSPRERSQLSAMKKADYLFVIAENHKKILEKMNINKKIHVFENISDIESMSKQSLKQSQLNGTKLKEKLNAENVLLYCGRLCIEKGSFGLFDSFDKIKKEYKNSKLILLGSGQEKIQDFFKYGLKKENLKDVIFVPWVKKDTIMGKEEFAKYYYASDVLIQPMITEKLFSKTVIDAMSIGIPAITCKSEYTIGTSRNSEEIFNSFVQFKENPNKVKEIIEKAKKKVKLENTWNAYISKMEKIIEN